MVTVRLLSSSSLGLYPNSTHPVHSSHMFPNSSHEVAHVLPDRPQFVFRGLSRTFHISLHPDTIFLPPSLVELTTESSRGLSFENPSPHTQVSNLTRVNPRFSDDEPAARLRLLLLRQAAKATRLLRCSLPLSRNGQISHQLSISSFSVRVWEWIFGLKVQN